MALPAGILPNKHSGYTVFKWWILRNTFANKNARRKNNQA
jgi:hypothetical protein